MKSIRTLLAMLGCICIMANTEVSAATAKRDEHIKSELTNHIGTSSNTPQVWGWHSSSSSAQSYWSFNRSNSDSSSGSTAFKIYNSEIPTYFSGSYALADSIVQEYELPAQVKSFINVYGVDNLGIKFTIGMSDNIYQNNITYSISGGKIKISFRPIFKVEHNKLWQNSPIWSNMASAGKISIPKPKAGYGTNYLSASYAGESGSIVVTDSVIANAKKTGETLGFNDGGQVQFIGNPIRNVPLKDVTASSAIFYGGAHGVYFDFPVKIDYYDLTLTSNSLSIADTEYKSGTTHWVKAGNDFTVTASAYASGTSNTVKVNANHLGVTYNGGTTYLDSRILPGDSTIPSHGWQDHSPNVDFVSGSGKRNGNTLSSSFKMTISGDKDITFRSLSRLVSFDNNLGSEKIYREVSSPNSITVKSDSQGPVISFSDQGGKWVASSITAHISISDSRSGVKDYSIKYRKDGGSWINSTVNRVTMDESGTYEVSVTAEDNVGNVSTDTRTYYIDKTAPIITNTSDIPSVWTNKDVTVSFTSSDTGSGVRENNIFYTELSENIGYELANTNTATFTKDGRYIVEFHSRDNVGNQETTLPIGFGIDKTHPNSLTFTPPSKDWTNKNISVSWIGTDALSGVESYSFRIATTKDGVTNYTSWSNYGSTTSTTITTEGINKIEVRVKDNAGNVKTFTSGEYKIDKTAPTITLSQNPTAWTNGNVTVTATITETDSGINTRKWATGNQNASYFANSGTTITSNKFTATANGTYTFYVKDNAGNEKVATINISNIDKTAPTITLSSNPTGWTNGNVTVTATIIETGSKVNIRKWASGNRDASYFAGNGGTTIASDTFTVTANGTYTFYVKDNAGNESVKTITITNIDKIAPTITGNFDNGWVKGSQTISFTTSDSVSGIKSFKLWNSNKSTVLQDGTSTKKISYVVKDEGITQYKVESIDNSNNKTEQNVTVKVDNTSPTTNITMPSVSNSITIKIQLSNITDVHSGVKEILISESQDFSSGVTKVSLIGNTSKTINFNLTPKDTFEKHFSRRTIYFRIVDNVGNLRDYQKVVQLAPKNPDKPVILSPTNDELYLDKDLVNIKWTYNSVDEHLGYLPQLKAEIQLKNIDTDETYIQTINNASTSFEFNEPPLGNGEYQVTVKVYNSLAPEVYSQSDMVTFRYNKRKSNGKVITKVIQAGSPIRYLSVLTTSELPEYTNITGDIYYDVDANGNINNANKKIRFDLTQNHTADNIIRLPKSVSRIKIEYMLNRDSSKPYISPALDHLVVLAK